MSIDPVGETPPEAKTVKTDETQTFVPPNTRANFGALVHMIDDLVENFGPLAVIGEAIKEADAGIAALGDLFNSKPSELTNAQMASILNTLNNINKWAGSGTTEPKKYKKLWNQLHTFITNPDVAQLRDDLNQLNALEAQNPGQPLTQQEKDLVDKILNGDLPAVQTDAKNANWTGQLQQYQNETLFSAVIWFILSKTSLTDISSLISVGSTTINEMVKVLGKINQGTAG